MTVSTKLRVKVIQLVSQALFAHMDIMKIRYTYQDLIFNLFIVIDKQLCEKF